MFAKLKLSYDSKNLFEAYKKPKLKAPIKADHICYPRRFLLSPSNVAFFHSEYPFSSPSKKS